MLADDSHRTRSFTLKSLTIVFTSQNRDIPTEFLVKAVEVTERLDDENQENREEAVRCLGALLHFTSERIKQVGYPVGLSTLDI